MKFAFIIPPVLAGKREVERVFGCTYGLYRIPNIFILYAAAVIRQEGGKASFIDGVALGWNRDSFSRYIKEASDEVFLFYTVNLARENDLESLKIIRKFKPHNWVIFMGPSPTHTPDAYLTEERVVVIRGEAERALSSLFRIFRNEKEIDEKALAACKGISYRLNEKIRHNPKEDAISDIDALPFPARDLLDKKRYFNPKLGITPFTALLTSRGCSFRCRYCVPNSLSFARELEFRKGSDSWAKPRVAIRSHENVCEELTLLKKDGYRAISILDDQFIWDGKREARIAEAMGRLGFAWGCLSRGDMITDEAARALGENNCKYVDVGIESFSQNILDDIGKGTSVDRVCKGIELLRKNRVPVKLNILLGASKLETMDTIKHTLSVARKLAPYSIMVSICNPFPGTEFWEIAQRERWLLTEQYKAVDVQKESTIEYPHLKKRELEDAIRRANLEFFLAPKFILANILRIKSPAALAGSLKSLFKKITNP